MKQSDLLIIYRDPDSWRIVANGDTALRWFRMFGTADLALPYPATMTPTEAKDHVQLLNPDYRIEQRETGPAADCPRNPLEDLKCLYSR